MNINFRDVDIDKLEHMYQSLYLPLKDTEEYKNGDLLLVTPRKIDNGLYEFIIVATQAISNKEFYSLIGKCIDTNRRI